MKQLVIQKRDQSNGAYAAEDLVTSSADNCGEKGHTAPSFANESAHETSATVFTVANGDILGGSSLLQNCQGSVAIETMNSIPIDIAVLGNHEFDYGDEVLMERIKESNSVWLGSNVYYPTDTESAEDDTDTSQLHPLPHDHGYFPGIHGNGTIYTLRNNLKLGVFGLVTKQTPKISYPSPKVIFDSDILAVARRTTQMLRSQGAQVIIAITHMSEAEDRLLAADQVAGVDLILGGHDHEPLNAKVDRNESDEDVCQNEGEVLVFKCGMNAYWVGSVDLDIEYDCEEGIGDTFQSTKITSIATSWSMHSVTSRTPSDPEVTAIVKKYRKATDKCMIVSAFGEELASTLDLDDVVATIGETGDLNVNSTTLPLDTRMSAVRRREATSGNLVADAMKWLLQTSMKHNDAPIPMLAMINGGFIRGDRLYKPGSDFTVRHILKELPFPRTMEVLEIEGRYLTEAIAQQLKGSSRGPIGSYPHLSHNARLEYGLSKSSTEEEVITIQSMTVDGLKVSDEQAYLIAVTGFVADGSEGCTSWLRSTRIHNPAWSNVNISCVVLKYLRDNPVIVPMLEGRVEIV